MQDCERDSYIKFIIQGLPVLTASCGSGKGVSSAWVWVLSGRCEKEISVI